MKSLFLIFLTSLFFLLPERALSQDWTPIKLKSNIYRVLSKASESSELQKSDSFIDHIIVIDAPNKIIKIYRNGIVSAYDVLSIPETIEKEKIVTYKFKCLDAESAECDASLVFYEKEPFYLTISWKLKTEMFFIKEE